MIRTLTYKSLLWLNIRVRVWKSWWKSNAFNTNIPFFFFIDTNKYKQIYKQNKTDCIFCVKVRVRDCVSVKLFVKCRIRTRECVGEGFGIPARAHHSFVWCLWPLGQLDLTYNSQCSRRVKNIFFKFGIDNELILQK